MLSDIQIVPQLNRRSGVSVMSERGALYKAIADNKEEWDHLDPNTRRGWEGFEEARKITFDFAEGQYKPLPVWPGEEDAMDVDEEETEVQIVSTLFLRLRFELTQVLLGCAGTRRSSRGREGRRRGPPEAA